MSSTQASSVAIQDSVKLEEWSSCKENPLNWPLARKGFVAAYTGFLTFIVAFGSSVYTGAVSSVKETFGGSDTIHLLGVSLYVLGFAFGPLIWAPLSETFGRRPILLATIIFFCIFNALAAASQSLAMLLVMRFFASAFGSSMVSNGGAIISDIFAMHQRGLAMAVFSAAPFSGPALGPIVGGFLGQAGGFRWVMGLLAIVSGITLVGGFFMPETYAPVLQAKRTSERSMTTGLQKRLATSMLRPFVILTHEPIVVVLALYQGTVYATLYSFFSAFPLVYGQARGWNAGQAALPFIAVLVGTFASLLYVALYDNGRYRRAVQASNRKARPEHRLPMACIAAVILPITLGCFAGLDAPSMPWIASTIFAAPFGFAMVLLFLATQTYIVDTYGRAYAASALAAVVFVRSALGAAFPLFTQYMYMPGGPDGSCAFLECGIHVGPAIAAGIALVFAPTPFLLTRYGTIIRARGTFTDKEKL